MHRVLFVDDELNVLNTLRRQLRTEPFEQVFVTNGKEALTLLEQQEFAAIVSDMRMPEMDGVAFLKEAKRRCPQTRRIILTGYAEVNSAIGAINDAQVHAYLVKPWTKESIKETIANELTRFTQTQDQQIEQDRLRSLDQQRQQEIESLQQEARVDALTGLSNRRSFEDSLEQEWRRAIREGHNLALIMIDIDRFKLVNDTAGHAEGDRILATLAQCLQENVQRPGDMIARYGGEEFVAVLPNTKSPQHLGEQFRACVEAMQIPHPGLPAPQVVTISVGVASYQPQVDDMHTPHDLLRAADQALYASKQNGRNQVTLSSFPGGNADESAS